MRSLSHQESKPRTAVLKYKRPRILGLFF